MITEYFNTYIYLTYKISRIYKLKKYILKVNNP